MRVGPRSPHVGCARRQHFSARPLAALLIGCLAMAAIAATTASAGDAKRAGHRGASAEPARLLRAHLDAWARCQLSRSRARWVDCSRLRAAPPELASVARSLRSLAPLDRLATPVRRGRGPDRDARRCLFAMSFEIRALLRARIRGHARSRAEGAIDRLCDGVEVAEDPSSRRGWVLPRACAHTSDAASRIEGARLGECVRTVAGTWLAEAGIGPPHRRPNVIVVLADDQRWDTIDATHSPLPDLGLPAMPATSSRLAAEGVTFTRAVVSTPVCGPSRGSFLTGRHTHRHGMLHNSGATGPASFEDDDTIATRLDEAGYRTGYLGKYTNAFTLLWDHDTEPPIVPPGWDDFRIFDHPQSVPQTNFKMLENGVRVDYAIPEAPYSTDVLATHALDFVDTAMAEAPDEPFALWIGTTTPHFPFHPAPRHVGAFAGYRLVAYPNTFEEDVSDKPAWIQERSPYDPLAWFSLAFSNRRLLEMQLSTDELVASLLDRLEHHGIGDDTIFVYTSDNGQAWGEHRYFTKGCPWDACLRVPLVVRYPRVVSGGRSVDGLVASVDLVPTLLDLAGLDAPDDTDGLDLGPVLRDAAPVPDREVLFEAYAGRHLTYAGLRSQKWKYIRYRNGVEELYDLVADPYELENAASDPAKRETLEALSARLDSEWPGFDAVMSR